MLMLNDMALNICSTNYLNIMIKYITSPLSVMHETRATNYISFTLMATMAAMFIGMVSVPPAMFIALTDISLTHVSVNIYLKNTQCNL